MKIRDGENLENKCLLNQRHGQINDRHPGSLVQRGGENKDYLNIQTQKLMQFQLKIPKYPKKLRGKEKTNSKMLELYIRHIQFNVQDYAFARIRNFKIKRYYQ